MAEVVSSEVPKLTDREIGRSLLDWVIGGPGGFVLTVILTIPLTIIYVAFDSGVEFGDLADELSLIHISEPTRPY